MLGAHEDQKAALLRAQQVFEKLLLLILLTSKVRSSTFSAG